MRTPGSDAAGIFLSVGGAVGEGRPVLPLSLACARAWGPQFCGRRSASAPGPAVRSPSDLTGAHSRGGRDGDGSQVPDPGQTLGTNVGDFSSVATSAAPTRAPGAMRVGPFGRSCHYSISLAGVKATFAPLAFFELAGGLRPPFCTWREQTQLCLVVRYQFLNSGFPASLGDGEGKRALSSMPLCRVGIVQRPGWL